jgi:hypothetical protein
MTWTRRLLLLGLALVAAPVLAVAPVSAGTLDNLMPLDQVKPGMKGVAYTIFAGDTIEKMDLEVVGILPNLMGPKQDIILVRLLGEKSEYTGVAAGMSGSPVYIDGKLVGALSLKFGIFTKEPIGGVTPIAAMLEADAPTNTSETTAAAWPQPDLSSLTSAAGQRQYPLPAAFLERTGLAAGAYLEPIETPLVFSGFRREALDRFAGELSSYGMVATQGGTAAPRPDDAQLQAGQMVGMVLVKGDLSLNAGCTVTAVERDRVFVCGHPLFGFGPVAMPMSRGRVLTTLVSTLASTKIMNAGGVIGSIQQDRLTAVVGHLGPPPSLIPIELSVATPNREKKFHFEVIEHPRLTPLLVAISAFNGLVANTVYSEGTTFQVTGSIEVEGHSAVQLENMFAPTDQGAPDGVFVALNVQSVFGRIYSNPYEPARIKRVSLRVESIPERRLGTIEGAWSERSEVSPGEQVGIKVLVRPYRGAPVLRELPITIPPSAHGPLRVLVSDSDTLNRMGHAFALSGQSRLAGLEQLITLLNRERRNNRLYLTLLQPTPTLLVEEKELPNAPVSQISVLDQQRAPGSSLLLRESVAGEWSLAMNQVITGQQVLTINVK